MRVGHRSFRHTVLTAFAGHVPDALKTKHPTANVTLSPGWCGFDQRNSHVPLLQASDPLFKQIGAALVQVQREEYGFDPDGVQFFNGDNFNEMHGNPDVIFDQFPRNSHARATCHILLEELLT